MARHIISSLLGALMLSGCMVGPDYAPPQIDAPGNWTEHAATPAEVARTQAQMRTWWATFQDPMLDRLVQLAIADNLDLRIAGQRLLAAHDVRDQVASQLAPQVDTVDQAGVQRFSNTLQYPPLPGISTSSRYWAPGFTASWELDVFGRIRRGIQAQDAEVGADIEARRGMLVAILGELADDYATLRATQRQVVLAHRDIEAAQEGLALTNRVFTEGLGNSLQVAQAQAELETEQSALPPLETRIAQLTHAIAVLVGQMPGSLEAELERSAPYPKVPALPVALPSMVIANRPDIRRAERQYAEASARIGVAVAQLYPDFSLPLSLGVQSSMVHELFAADSLAFQLVLSAAQPLYRGGRLSAQVREKRAEAEAARLGYRQALLIGFREVEDRLVAYRNDSLRDTTLHRAAADNALALDRARRLYSAGLVGFLDVLTAERATYQAQDLAALGDLAELTDAVGLYTALGAGWHGVWLTDTQLPVDTASQHGMVQRLDHLRRELFP